MMTLTPSLFAALVACAAIGVWPLISTGRLVLVTLWP